MLWLTVKVWGVMAKVEAVPNGKCGASEDGALLGAEEVQGKGCCVNPAGVGAVVITLEDLLNAMDGVLVENWVNGEADCVENGGCDTPNGVATCAGAWKLVLEVFTAGKDAAANGALRGILGDGAAMLGELPKVIPDGGRDPPKPVGAALPPNAATGGLLPPKGTPPNDPPPKPDMPNQF